MKKTEYITLSTKQGNFTSTKKECPLKTNEQYISISINDYTPAQKVLTYMVSVYPDISDHIYDVNKELIILKIPEHGINIEGGLNGLQRTLNEICLSNVVHFAVNEDIGG